MKRYGVLYKLYQDPGTDVFWTLAENKDDARNKFILSMTKYDLIIKIIT